jgi:hypothetical protein
MAKCLVSEDAQVFITRRRQTELGNAVAEIGSGVAGLQGDVANPTLRVFAT